MKPFLDDDFLLQTETARRLYHDHAARMPVIDYHCHLPPQQIADNRHFENLTQIWLEGDHYKWRAMRANGVPERCITGEASDFEKFMHWAETVPYTLRNPLYHWTHLELQRYFDIKKLLSGQTAAGIYEQCGEMLAQPEFSTQGILRRMRVEVVCTTDDPTDDLSAHKALADSDFETRVLPTFRPDKAYSFDNPAAYNAYLQKLSEASNIEISTYDDLLAALENRVDFFAKNGCQLADHGLERMPFAEATEGELRRIFQKIKEGNALEPLEKEQLATAVLLECCRMYHRRGWAQQFHLGALRNNNERMMRLLGPDTGFDSIGDFPQVHALAQFFSRLDGSDQLAKTILYCLNPADNEAFATMIGNFNDGSVAGKMQFGSAWWFLDQKGGMERQLDALSNMGLLSRFVGMLTDSRSFLSYPRHEYFRRILCNLLGNDVENGELPNEPDWLGKIVEGICYFNAKEYFKFD